MQSKFCGVATSQMNKDQASWQLEFQSIDISSAWQLQPMLWRGVMEASPCSSQEPPAIAVEAT
jgi:hypothetical protein